MEEYARTEKGEIGKVTKIINELVFINTNQYWSHIAKQSKNIIDLIEVGDIVDKSEVYEIGQSDDGQKWVHTYKGILYYEEDLEKATILTHEQYNANCYKVKGE